MNKMDCSGYIQVLKRNGEKGSRFPMMERCVIGGGLNCDMRIYLKGIANQHCVVFTDNTGRGVIENLTDQYPTILNDSALKEGERRILGHGDVFTIIDRTFLWEYLESSQFFGKTLSKNTSYSDKKVTGALTTSQHSVSSPRRVAVVTPVRRGDLVQNKKEQQRKSIPATKFYRHSLQDPQAVLKKKIASRRSCTPHLVAIDSALEKKQGEAFLDVVEKSPSRIKEVQANNNTRKSGKRFSVGISKRKSLAKENTPSAKKARMSVLKSSPVISTPKKNLDTISVAPTKTPLKSKTPAKKAKSPVASVKSPSKSASPVKKIKSPVAVAKTPLKSKTPAKNAKSPVASMKSPSKSASPVKTKSPVAVAKTPLKSKTPAKKGKSPVASVKSPSKSASPVKTKSPVAVAKTPLKSKTPAKKGKSPVASVKSPSKSASPVKKIKSPSALVKTPTKAASPMKRAKTQSVQGKTPSGSARSQNRGGAERSKKSGFVSRLKTPVKRMLDTPSSEQQVAKRVKLDNKSQISTESNTSRPIRKPLFSEVVKKSEGKKVASARKIVKPTQIKAFRNKIKKPSVIPRITKLANSTGHAESPETIIIRKNINTPRGQKKTNQTPKARKSLGRKSLARKSLARNTVAEFNISDLKKVTSPMKVSPAGKTKSSPAAISSAKLGRSSVVSSPAAKKSTVGQKTPRKVTTPVSHQKNAKSPGSVKSSKENVKQTPSPVTPVARRLSKGQQTPKSEKITKSPASPKGGISKNSGSPVKTGALKSPLSGDKEKKRVSQGKKTPVRMTPSPKTPASPAIVSPMKKATPRDIIAAKNKLSSERKSRLSVVSTPVVKKSPKGQKSSPSPKVTKLSPSPRRSLASPRTPRQQTVATPATPASKRSSRGRSTPESTVVRKSVSPRKSMQPSQQEVGGVGIPTQRKSVSVKERTPSPVKSIAVSRSSGRKEKTILNVSFTSPESSNLQRTPAKRKLEVPQESTSSVGKRSKRSTIGGSPDIFNISDSFDLSSVQTPQIPQETFVSPLSVSKSSQKRKGSKASFLGDSSLSLYLNDSNKALTPKSESSRMSTPRKTLNNSRVNMVTPKKAPILADIAEIPDVLVATAYSKSPLSASRSSPKASPRKLASPKTSTPAKSPAQQKLANKSPTPSRAAVRVSPGPKSPKKSISPTRAAHGRSMSSPNIIVSKRTSTPLKTLQGRSSSTPNINSKTPKVLETSKDVSGTEVQNRSTRSAVSPKRSNSKSPVKKASAPKVQASPKNDLRDVRGLKKLLSTPKVQASPKNDLRDVRGLKKLLATPKVQASPKNDLRDVRGLKKLLSTPKVQASPKNDLRDVRGLKKLLSTPKVQASPKNDLRDVRGVKKLLSSPKVQASPKNDLTDVRGVKKLLSSPKIQSSPRNDLSDVRGVKKLMRTPVKVSSPRNDLTNVSGVKELFESPELPKSPVKSPKMAKADVSGSRTTRTRGRNVDKVLPSPKRKGRSNAISSPIQTSTPTKKTRAAKSNVSVDSVVLTEKTEVDISVVKASKTRTNHNSSSKTNVSIESITISEIGEVDDSYIRTTRTRRKRNITESSDNNEIVAASPPKSRRAASKPVVSNSPASKSSEVASPQKGRRTRTKSTYVEPSKPQKPAADAKLSPSKSGNKDSPLPKTRNVRSRTKLVEASVSPKASKAVETSSAVTVSPVATRRGRTKSTVVETSKLKQSKSSKDELPAVEKVSSPQRVASPPKARRGRTKTQEVKEVIPAESPVTKKTRSRAAAKSSPAKSSPVKSSPVKSSPLKTRRRAAKKADVSQNTTVQNTDTSQSDISSVLTSPLKKQTRSKRSDTKTVTFTDNAPILVYEASSPIRPAKKGAREASKSKKVEEVGEAVPARAARGRRAPAAAASSVDESEAVTTRATRSRRK